MARDGEHDEVAQLAQRVALHLKALRAARGLTLDELAARSGVSRATLSQIETCGTNPTLAVLWKVAAGLEVPFSALIGEGSADERVRRVRIAQQPVIHGQGGSIESRPLTAGRLLGNVEIYELTLAAGAEHASAPHAPGTREALMVLSGRVRLRVGDAVHEAGPREALLFAADEEHAYANPGTRPTRLLDVIVYATAPGSLPGG